MIRILLATILWLCLLPATAHAQPTLANLETISPVPLGEWDFEGGQLHFPETVFASLPAAGTSGRIYIVTDATTSSDCTAGGGTSRALCRDTGAIWESIGGSGGGGGNSFVTWDMPVGTDPVADSAIDTITFVCPPPMVCAGNSSTDTLTLSVTTPTPTVTATGTATASSTPTATPTPTVTVTTTAFVCGAGSVLDRAHPEACVVLPTPDGGGAGYPTPTVVVTVTPTPIVCATNAAWGLGGLFKAHPEECQAVGPTPTPTATATASPTATLTSAPTATATPFNYAAGDAPGGGATKVTGSATLPATCTEKEIYQDTDSGGTEFYVCTATDTWTKVIAGSDVPANETDPTVPLLSLADLGDLCAAGETTARNGGDTANVCVAFPVAYPTPTAVVSATPTATATNTASPMPISTASPGLAGAVLGTSLTMARADHVHPMPDSGVTGGSYINSNITVNSKGLVTAASDGTAFPNSFALYVEKWGTDSTTCGSILKPCAGIATSTGAFAKILANNDNGFYTCSSNGSDGCGMCATTNTACNENADCGGSLTSCSGATCCAAYTCSNNASRGCGYVDRNLLSPVVAVDADCTGGGTCGANTSAACTVSGTCTGPPKSYSVELGAGDWVESLTGANKIPSPGSVSLHGGSASRIYTLSDLGAIDLSDRLLVTLNAFNVLSLANAPAIFTTGTAKQITLLGTGVVASGTASAVKMVNNLDCTGSGLPAYAAACCTGYHTGTCGNGNGTWTWRDPVVWQYGLYCGDAAVDFTLKGGSCSQDTTRACLSNTGCVVCVGGPNNDVACSANSECPSGTCATTSVCSGLSSGDIDIKGLFIQTDCPNLDAYGMRIRYDACGTNFNQLYDHITMLVGNPGPAISYGLRVEETSCNPYSNVPGPHAGNGSLWKNIVIEGNTNTGGYVPPDVSLSIGKDTGIWINGPFAYNACTRELQNGPGSISYTDSALSDQKGLGGGAGHDLGVLWCAEPKRVCFGGTNVRAKCTAASECPGGTCPIKDGEFWYARTLNGTPVATITPTPTVTVTTTAGAGASATPTPTRTATYTPTPSPTKTSATASPTATATPFGGARFTTGGKTLEQVGLEGTTTADGGSMILRRLDGVTWFTLDDAPGSLASFVTGAQTILALQNSGGSVMTCGAGGGTLCTVTADPAVALGIVTKQLLDAQRPKVRTTTNNDVTGTLADDTIMNGFPVAAGLVYLVEGDLYVTTTGAADELKLAFQGASGDTCSIIGVNIGQDHASQAPQRITDCDNSPTSQTINLQSGDNFVHYSGYFKANGAGTLDLQFATSAGNTTINVGSWMRVTLKQ